jgi:predicted metalloprotease with PDZ domain
MHPSFFRRLFVALQVLILPNAQAQEGVQHLYLNLVDTDSNQVEVSLHPPAFTRDTAIYNMPKIVPGTYSISDFGRFVEGFVAISRKGDTLATIRLDTNRWALPNATELDHIRYRVNDTFSEPMGGGIFEPGGTAIVDGQVVLLNVFGFAGYFDGAKNQPVTMEVLRPAHWYGATSLSRGETRDNTDTFHAANYFGLHDCPILYCSPDTTRLKVANATIEVAVYSPTGMVKSAEVMAQVKDIFDASAAYLGGELPVSHYSILLYMSDGGSFSRAYGALEHMTSTVFVLPEAPVPALSQTIKDVAAHEFFHIVTPLNIHSEQIHDYDFMNPQMSKHLWLYEGCTEYAAQHVQVKQGLVDVETFLNTMRGKILSAERFSDEVPFTELSLGALDAHKDLYGNVYQKGALIGMALDLKLRSLSNGSYGIQDLMKNLSAEYGEDKPFVDDSLFAEIGRVSGFAETQSFLEKYVGGTTPLPLPELLAPFGIRYAEELTQMELSAGSLRIGYNPRREAVVLASKSGMDAFGKSLGLEVGDELVKWDGQAVDLETFEAVINGFKKRRSDGDKFKIVVNKKAKNYKQITIKAKAMELERSRKNVMQVMDAPSVEQVALRKAWIGQ